MIELTHHTLVFNFQPHQSPNLPLPCSSQTDKTPHKTHETLCRNRKFIYRRIILQEPLNHIGVGGASVAAANREQCTGGVSKADVMEEFNDDDCGEKHRQGRRRCCRLRLKGNCWR
ncbi:hypothetical protein AAHE18_06G182000 [Arachis hypogaea]